jgi:hypothetical protein
LPDWLLPSYVVLWVLVVAEALILTGALRQIGHLWRRIGPERPLDRLMDLEIGELMAVDWLPASPLRRAVLFVSPSCGICEGVLAGLGPLLRSRDELVIVCQATAEAAARYLSTYGLSDLTLVADADGELSASVGINETPVAVVLDADQRVERAAIVNSPQQVESLLMAHPAAA